MSVETNFGELLLNAAEARPEGVCVETEAAAYTFEQVVFLWLPFAEHFGKPLGRSVQSCLPSRLICVDTNAFQMSMW